MRNTGMLGWKRWASLVFQWLKNLPASAGYTSWISAWEDSTCCEATKPEPTATKPVLQSQQQLLKPMHLQSVPCNRRSHQPTTASRGQTPIPSIRESPHAATLRAAQNKYFLKRNWTVSNTCLIRFISSCQKTHLDWHPISQSSQILSHVDERGTRWWGPWKLFYESIFVNFSTIFWRQQ